MERRVGCSHVSDEHEKLLNGFTVVINFLSSHVRYITMSLTNSKNFISPSTEIEEKKQSKHAI
ncbi:CLUMA_CG001143, isoform A [Clunio marinus]|uniref:CLUMA_CG001143, isoform A n=1 Tax=Clunio marinus TaxID=568069 RepID=A0A1J1HH58_9DIPT|nr:CLUMA_CG001143, isoform A [Clunio marinus]